MSKDPAFLFYTSDFLTGTMLLSDEQVGKYIRLLCLQQQKGVLSEKDMLIICKSYDEDIWAKFKKNESGFFYNERCKFEIDRRKKFSDSRSANRKSTDNKTIKPKKKTKSYVKHMETETVIVNETEIVKENKTILDIKLQEFFDFRIALKKPIIEASKDAFKQKLIKLSNGNESAMIEILDQSIANGWQGIFELKNTNNGKQQTNNNSNKASLASLTEQSRKILQGFESSINNGDTGQP